jgi:hypothetical protein
MTNVSTDHPENIPFIELTDLGRKISFKKECLGDVKIYRQVNGGERLLLIENSRTPFVDQDAFSAGTQLLYSIELKQDNESKQYELEVRL